MDTLKLKLRPCTIVCCQSQTHPKHGPSQSQAKKIHYLKQGGIVNAKDTVVGCALLVQNLSRKSMCMSDLGMKSVKLLPDDSELSALMICYADNGLSSQAQKIWQLLLNSSFVPSIQILSNLMDAYGRMGLFQEIIEVLDQVRSRNFSLLPQAYSHAISSFGKQGQLQLMENTLKQMVSSGFPVDFATGNAYIKYYSTFGSLREMETAYHFLKQSRHLINEEGIRAVAFAYLKEKKFYKLGLFLRDVGLGRKDVGNLLWNFLLLSYAANFKMKSLQREFLRMLEAGFCPDITTFNIRAVAFSKMSLFWDLHLSLEHMKHENVVPDLVTYGCFVDAYLDKRLGRNLDFVFSITNLDDSPLVLTDPVMFEVLGKGDFHSSSEAFMEFGRGKKWTYRSLLSLHLKKQFRRNQIFWNY